MVEFRDVSSRVLWSSLRPDEKGSSHSVREGDADGPRIGRASSNVNQLRGVIAVVQASTNRPLPAPGWLCRCLCLWKTPARVMKLDISRAGPTKWMKPGRLDVDGEMIRDMAIRTLLFHEAIHNSQYVCSPPFGKLGDGINATRRGQSDSG